MLTNGMLCAMVECFQFRTSCKGNWNWCVLDITAVMLDVLTLPNVDWFWSFLESDGGSPTLSGPSCPTLIGFYLFTGGDSSRSMNFVDLFRCCPTLYQAEVSRAHVEWTLLPHVERTLSIHWKWSPTLSRLKLFVEGDAPRWEIAYSEIISTIDWMLKSQ